MKGIAREAKTVRTRSCEARPTCHTWPAPQSFPLVLIEEIASRQLVAVACELARPHGVRHGMTLAQARALCPGGDLAHAPHDPAADLRGLVAPGRWLVRFSPVVAPEPPAALSVDVTGSERLFGGLDNLARRVAEALGRLGVGHRIAIAPTPGAAWAFTDRCASSIKFTNKDDAVIAGSEPFDDLTELAQRSVVVVQASQPARRNLSCRLESLYHN